MPPLNPPLSARWVTIHSHKVIGIFSLAEPHNDIGGQLHASIDERKDI